VDSGSSGTFINAELAHKLKFPLVSTDQLQVTIAGGGKLTSNCMVKQLIWWTQGQTFVADARVLPLGTYDIILGMDWLEQHSPMWVHW
jgi:hypothetical protein